MGTWLSPGRAEPILSFISLAAPGWNSMRKGGKVGTKGSGVTEGICPKRWTREKSPEVYQLRIDGERLERDVQQERERGKKYQKETGGDA